MKWRRIILVSVVVVCSLSGLRIRAQGTEFLYEGRLTESGVPTSGLYDMEFRLFDNAQVGTSVAGPVTTNGVGVINGIFSVLLDFGGAPFNGQALWLELGVRTNGLPSGAFAYFSPRQGIAPTPYAIRALTAGKLDGSLTVTQLPSVVPRTDQPAGFRETVTFSNTAVALNAVGRVGIGTAAPARLLEVGGTIRNSAYDARWTTSLWGKALELQPGGVIQWLKGSGIISRGIGFTNNNLCFIRSFANDSEYMATNDLVLDAFGNLGVGTSTPQSRMEVVGTVTLDASRTSNQFVRIVSSGGVSGQGGLRFDQAAKEYFVVWTENTGSEGVLVTGLGSPSDNYKTNRVMWVDRNGVGTRKLTITGGADLAEPFETSDGLEASPGTVMSIDPACPGRLRIAREAYDHKVAGVVSGANGLNAGVILKDEKLASGLTVPLALAGRAYCWADADNGEITPGDLLTSASTPGHCMRASDPVRVQGTIIGKAMTGLSEGRGLILVLISLQ